VKGYLEWVEKSNSLTENVCRDVTMGEDSEIVAASRSGTYLPLNTGLTTGRRGRGGAPFQERVPEDKRREKSQDG